ncbi:calcium homeostasis endoplasmic reticulum protein [Neofusicoccum parvum]|uniref:Calcium homeostasis endoplasmic reticulum protein n=1 Tax=Neofusicoccum parvum TaxID=310453 RepID=A0ACB5SHT8_9PEZI|nr:calcium homeostasis endoplasmic reticulum protein [Neofusicoccum parvum]
MAAALPPQPQAAPPLLVVAKAVLTAALMRADPTSVAKDDIDAFHRLLDAAVQHCSPAHFQNCKEWLLQVALRSTKRVDALGKYLVKLAQTIAEEQPPPHKVSRNTAPSNRRRLLHLLYLLNDIVHHQRTHDAPVAELTKTLEPHLELLFTTALSLQMPARPKLRQRVAKLTELYEDSKLYSEGYRKRVRKALQEASVPSAANPEPASSTSKDAVWALPAFHGDPNDPWYDLPAGALMPHMRPNDPRPVDPYNIKPVDLRNKTVDNGLINAVKDLLGFAADLDNEDEGIVADIDMMGQPVVQDEASGELTVTNGYYGWSVWQKQKRLIQKSE